MYRLYEMIPGGLAWGTLLAVVLLSWKLPFAITIFAILYDVFWLLKSIYLLFHLRATYKEMRANLATDWQGKLRELHSAYRIAHIEGSEEQIAYPPVGEAGRGSHTDWREMYHLVILPMYKEPYEVVRESFESLRHSAYPKDKIMVVLAIEERAGGQAVAVARRIEAEYEGVFSKLFITSHPANLPDEIPGKGSNEAWAAKIAKRELIDAARIPYESVIVSVFDIDTQAPPGYFSRLTYMYSTVKDPTRAIYQPVPLFVNNIYESPAIARVISFSCTFWSMMQQSRRDLMRSFSSQSIPFKALVDVGFWQKDIVAEDSRIFAQCLIYYGGDFRVEPMAYPVHMDANVAPTFWGTLKQQYLQQRRWAWGSEDAAYLLWNFRRNKKIPARVKWYWGFFVTEEYHSWATNSILIFIMGWLALFLGGRDYNQTLISYNLPHLLQYILSFSMVGIATSAIIGVMLLPPRPKAFRKRDYLYFIFQWLLSPVTLILFGAIPALEAQTRLMLGGRFRLGFWVTPKSRKRVVRPGLS